MRIICLLLLAFVGQATPAVAQPNPDSLEVGEFAYTGSFSVQGSQVGLSNWAGGGEEAINLASLLSLQSLNKYRKARMENSLELSFGLTRQESNDLGWEKSDDVIQFASRYSRQTAGNWYWTGLAKFRTQFAPGRKQADTPEVESPQRVLVSEFLSPGYLNISLGGEYQAGKVFNLLLSPLSGKMTIVANDSLAALGAYGVEAGENTRFEGGSAINIQLRLVPMENVRLESKVDLFSNYTTYGNIDINFENLIILKANDLLSTSITTNLIYDDDIDIQREDGTVGPDTQFKWVLAAGFMYNF